MNFKEFWKLYHREDPDEANANPHRLRIHLKDGSKHDVMFPGSCMAADTTLFVGVGPQAKVGRAKSTKFCNWSDVVKVEELKKPARMKARH